MSINWEWAAWGAFAAFTLVALLFNRGAHRKPYPVMEPKDGNRVEKNVHRLQD